MTTIVFIGPTLAADEVRARLPGAEVCPPAAVGDVLRATMPPIVPGLTKMLFDAVSSPAQNPATPSFGSTRSTFNGTRTP